MQHYPGDDIGVFLAVCDAGSFVSASKRLRLSPSAVAKAVARLEARLSVRLFKRTTRSLSLTDEGEVYRNVCSSGRQQVERVELALRNLSHEPAGLVRVSLPPLLGAEVVAPALYDLTRHWPNLRFDVAASTTPSELQEDNVDLAVRIGEVPDAAGLMARFLGKQEIVLCASAGYFSCRPRPEAIADLDSHDIIGTGRNGKVAPWQFRREDGALTAWTPHARLLIDGSLLALAAIRQGHGLGRVPRWLVQADIDAGRIVTVLDERIAGHLPVHVLWPASPIMLPRLRISIDAIVAAVRGRLG